MAIRPLTVFPITWTSSGVPAYAPVEISLYRDGRKVKTLIQATPNDGLWNWRVCPEPRGDAFTIRINLLGRSDELFDESDNPFLIALPGEW